MTLVDDARDWATERATSWTLDGNGRDRLTIDGFGAASALRIEVFDILVGVALDAGPAGSDLGRAGWLGALKRRGLDRAARSAALRLLSRLPGRGSAPTGAHRAPIDALFMSELATPSTLEPQLAVAAALSRGDWQVAAADPRAYRVWSRHSAPLAVTLPLRDERAVLRRWGQEARERWNLLVRNPPAFVVGDRDVTPVALRRIEPLIRRSLPWLGVEREALARQLDRLAPRWVVLASDQHRLGRVSVDLARPRGVRTIVLQHGLPQYRIGFLPVVADLVATWSDAVDQWFVDHGTPAGSLAQVGNPRLDRLVSSDRGADCEMVSRRWGLEGQPHLLVALSPGERQRNLAVLRLSLEAAERHERSSVIVKLHPGDGNWGYVANEIASRRALRGRVAIAHRDALYPLLHWADVTVLERSTVAVESLAAGTPVILAVVGDAGATIGYDDLALPRVSDPEELARRCSELVNPAAREEFIRGRHAAMVRSAGPLDGRSADRVAALLLEGLPGGSSRPTCPSAHRGT